MKLLVDYDDLTGSNNTTNAINTTLIFSYNGEDKCLFQNFTTILQNNHYSEYKHHPSSWTTNIIPNMFEKSLEGDDKKTENELIQYFEDVLSVIVPILGFLFLIICIVRCRKIRLKRVRTIVTISQIRRNDQQAYIDLNTSIEESAGIINSIV